MGSRLTGNGMDKVYAAALRWVDCALQSDGSLFTPGKPIWSSARLAELRHRLQRDPDRRICVFMNILRLQLQGSQPDVYQLMAEALYIYYIAPTMTSKIKADNINQVLGFGDLSSQVKIPANLRDPLPFGIAHFGEGMPRTSFSVRFLIEFVEQWKRQSESIRGEMLKDPWAFKNFVKGLEFQNASLQSKTPNFQRDAILHLIFPDTFEAIVNDAHKEKIAHAFPDAVKYATDDIDRKLQQIRANIEEQIGDHDRLFYKPVIRSHWDKRVSNCLQ